jgi:hypothetical protein
MGPRFGLDDLEFFVPPPPIPLLDISPRFLGCPARTLFAIPNTNGINVIQCSIIEMFAVVYNIVWNSRKFDMCDHFLQVLINSLGDTCKLKYSDHWYWTFNGEITFIEFVYRVRVEGQTKYSVSGNVLRLETPILTLKLECLSLTDTRAVISVTFLYEYRQSVKRMS